MYKFVIAAALSGSLLAGAGTSVALAQSAAAPAPRDPMLQADTNRDGVVTRAEAQAGADTRFAAMDANKDGKITRDERRANRPRGPRPDTNGDGALTRAEAMAAAERRFTARDTNKDGTITREERRAGKPHGRRMGRHMREGGPRGPMREMTQAQFRDAALSRFDRIDANHDGRVDANEREAMKLVMRARMADHDRGPTGK